VIFYVGSGLSYRPVRGDMPQINAGWDNRQHPSGPAIKFEDRPVVGCTVGLCVVKYVVSGQVPCMEAGVSETRQKILLWVLPLAGVPRNFASFGMEQTSYCLLHEEVTRLGMVADFGHSCLEDVRHSISNGLDRLKQDSINHRVASRTAEGRRAGNQDPSVQVCRALPPPFCPSWSHISGPCEYRGSVTCSGRCGGRRYGEGTRAGPYRLGFSRSTNRKHRGCSRLISGCARAYTRSGSHTVSAAQGLAWPSRSRTVLRHTRGMQGRAGHEQAGAALTGSTNAYSNVMARSDKG